MRNITRSIALAVSVAVLSTSLPAFAAAPRQGRDAELPTVIRMMKKIVKRLVGVITVNDAPTVPKPAPAPDVIEP